ncbi:MAG: TadE family protein [Sphingomicrobium sp.]
MRINARLVRDDAGTAAAEMALVIPLLVALMFGCTELGRYFWSQHVLVKAVRDGSVYAARQRIDNFDCTNSTVAAPVVTQTQTLVRTGRLSGGTALLPNWGSGTTVFAIDLACVTSANGTTLGGIYSANSGQVPVITVRASLPFTSMFGLRSGLTLNAREQAAVFGA